jgi:hypothetical protein
MGLFDLLAGADRQLAQAPSPMPQSGHPDARNKLEQTKEVIAFCQELEDTQNEPVSSDTSIISAPENDAIVEAAEVSQDDGWLDARDPKGKKVPAIPIFETKPRAVSLENLVWAPYYRVQDKLFPARLCDNHEGVLENWIATWPLPEDEILVEVFCQEKLAKMSRLLVVKKNKILPYWAENKDDQEGNYDKREWNEKRMNATQKVSPKHTSRWQRR